MTKRKNKPGAGRPRIVDPEAVLAEWRRDKSRTCAAIAAGFGVSKGCIYVILRRAPDWERYGLTGSRKLSGPVPGSTTAAIAAWMNGGGRAPTLEAVAQRFGVTREMVRLVIGRWAPLWKTDTQRIRDGIHETLPDAIKRRSGEGVCALARSLGVHVDTVKRVAAEHGIEIPKASHTLASALRPGTKTERVVHAWQADPTRTAFDIARELGITTRCATVALRRWCPEWKSTGRGRKSANRVS